MERLAMFGRTDFTDLQTLPGGFSVSDIPEAVWLIAAKLAGAVAGSVISVAYLLPEGRREAAIRFLVGLLTGLGFGSLAGVKIVQHLGLEGEIGRIETVLIGSAAASLCAWWALGILHRIALSYGSVQRPRG
jgi:hypothetical protein